MTTRSTTEDNANKSAFEKWQSEAYTDLDCLAEKLLDRLDQIIIDMVRGTGSFSEKLTLIASYVGHGQPGRAFSFIDRTEFNRWLSGEIEPPKVAQEAIIQLCMAYVGSAVHEGSSFDRVLNLMSFVKQGNGVRIVGLTTDSLNLWFNPWEKISFDRTEKEDMIFSTRVNSCLRNESVRYLGQLVQIPKGNLRRFSNMGRQSVSEVSEILTSRYGASLGMKHPELEKFNEELRAENAKTE